MADQNVTVGSKLGIASAVLKASNHPFHPPYSPGF
jgi:hypothetical protein